MSINGLAVGSDGGGGRIRTCIKYQFDVVSMHIGLPQRCLNQQMFLFGAYSFRISIIR